MTFAAAPGTPAGDTRSVCSRRAGYEDVNDAERLSVDPLMREHVLNNAFCSQCGGARPMNLLEGRLRGGMLVVSGTGRACGGAVARAIELPGE